jgi:hypothetical protein
VRKKWKIKISGIKMKKLLLNAWQKSMYDASLEELLRINWNEPNVWHLKPTDYRRWDVSSNSRDRITRNGFLN